MKSFTEVLSLLESRPLDSRNALMSFRYSQTRPRSSSSIPGNAGFGEYWMDTQWIFWVAGSEMAINVNS